MDSRINLEHLRTAHVTCLIFAVIFSMWTIGLVTMVIALTNSRPERMGFAFCTAAAAVALWVVWWMIDKARRPTTRR